jgi:hypothetical protein
MATSLLDMPDEVILAILSFEKGSLQHCLQATPEALTSLLRLGKLSLVSKRFGRLLTTICIKKLIILLPLDLSNPYVAKALNWLFRSFFRPADHVQTVAYTMGNQPEPPSALSRVLAISTSLLSLSFPRASEIHVTFKMAAFSHSPDVHQLIRLFPSTCRKLSLLGWCTLPRPYHLLLQAFPSLTFLRASIATIDALEGYSFPSIRALEIISKQGPMRCKLHLIFPAVEQMSISFVATELPATLKTITLMSHYNALSLLEVLGVFHRCPSISHLSFHLPLRDQATFYSTDLYFCIFNCLPSSAALRQITIGLLEGPSVEDSYHLALLAALQNTEWLPGLQELNMVQGGKPRGEGLGHRTIRQACETRGVLMQRMFTQSGGE